jgi:signal transduction histidine kinase
MAVALVALTVAVRMVMDPWLGENHPYTFFFAAIAFTSWYAGFWPSILALALSYFAGDWFFAAPRQALDLENFAREDFAGLGCFLFSGLAIAFTSRAMHAARDRSETRRRALAREMEERRRVQQELELAQAKLGEHAASLEEKVNERTRALRQSFQSLENVLYHVAHDLRAPLRSMNGLTTLLLEDYGSHFDEKGREYAEQIMVSAVRMDILIKALLIYGRLGHVPLPVQQVDMERTIAVVLDLLSTEISTRGAVMQIDRPLAPVMGNESVVQQILLNLVINALTYVHPGLAPHIHIWSDCRGNGVRLCVKDNGIGIAPEYHQRIFNVFESLRGADQETGTGIGLAIVAKGVERLGGRAGVESELGKGSTFWIELPSPPQANRCAGDRR